MIEVIHNSRASTKRRPPERGTTENLNAYSQTPMYYSGLSLISESVASTEWELYATRGIDGKIYRNTKCQRANTWGSRMKMIKQQGGDEVQQDHPMYTLLANPNPYLTGHAALQVFQIHIDAVGEGCLLKQRNELGVPVALWPIPPSWIVDIPGPSQDSFRFRIDGSEAEVPMSEVVWAKKPNPADPYGRGAGVGRAIADEIDTDEYASKFLKEFFYNDATPPILVTAEGAGKDDIERVESKWMQKLRGVGKKFLPHFVTWNAKVETIGYSLDQLKMVDLRRFEQDMIRHVLRIPPEKLGIIENSNRSTIEAADHIFTTNVVLPRLEFLRNVFQEQLAVDFDDRIVVHYVSPVKEDREFKLSVMQTRPQAFTDNEVREIAGVQEEAWADERWAPFSFAPIPAKSIKKMQRRTKELAAGDQSLVSSVLASVAGPEMASALEQSAMRSINVFGRRTMQLSGLSPDDFFAESPETIHYAKAETASRVTGLIDKTTLDALNAQLVEGFEAGETIDAIADRVQEVFADASRRRAITIARTETVRSSNFGAMESMRQAGIQQKMWLSSRDDRVRESHGALDGVTIPVNGQFTSPVTGAFAVHPGAFGVAEDDINCRCTVIPAAAGKDVTPEVRKGIWKAAENDRIPIESATVDAVRAAFESQATRVIKVLKEAGDGI